MVLRSTMPGNRVTGITLSPSTEFKSSSSSFLLPIQPHHHPRQLIAIHALLRPHCQPLHCSDIPPLATVLHWTTTAILRPETRQVAFLRSRPEPIKLSHQTLGTGSLAAMTVPPHPRSGTNTCVRALSRSWDLDPVLIATPRARSPPLAVSEGGA